MSDRLFIICERPGRGRIRSVRRDGTVPRTIRRDDATEETARRARRARPARRSCRVFVLKAGIKSESVAHLNYDAIILNADIEMRPSEIIHEFRPPFTRPSEICFFVTVPAISSLDEDEPVQLTVAAFRFRQQLNRTYDGDALSIGAFRLR
ncbi:hypothetical protein EVAR_35596_1 [Eumeta japonica]|uniref:Uncharacterized protein n=1 Tax=Eumeta variegata TaxID=151549 RepID=A0A4C1WC53_EUMVA|nr:hypothetical protein EVAR_35596_1 [Eumeta japonica]